MRRVAAEPVLGLLLGRALTLEVAHCKVGAGVSDHSSFERFPLRRGMVTGDAAVRLVWGRPDVARAAAKQIYRFHDGVHGELREPAGDWPAGAAYTAHDASLLLWVWATLVDTTFVGYSRWVHALEGREADDYYADISNFARFFGIPPGMIPPDRHAFAEYYEGVLSGGDLVPTPTSKAMVKRVLWFRHRNVPPGAIRLARVLAIGTLDPRICERFELEMSPADRQLFGSVDGLLSRWYRYRPAPLFQFLPIAYAAVRGPMVRRLPTSHR